MKGIAVPEAELAESCGENYILELTVFGSVLGDDFNPESDVSVLVELLAGRKVALRTPQDLSRYFREEVLASVEVQYT